MLSCNPTNPSSLPPLQTPTNQYTQGVLSCRWWNAATFEVKLGHLIGFGEASNLASDKWLHDLTSSDFTIREYLKGEDVFCGAPENAIVSSVSR